MLSNPEDGIDFRGLTSVSLWPMLFSLVKGKSLRDHCQAEANIAWGFRSSGPKSEPIAMLLARINSSPKGNKCECYREMEICSLAVRKPWQGKGIARNLLQAATGWAETQALDQVTLAMPENQAYTPALKRLTSLEAGWNDSPGKVIVTLSDPIKVGALLVRLEKMAKRQKQRWGWKIAPYPDELTSELQARLTEPGEPNIGKPYDPNQPYSIGWHSLTYSRLLMADDKLVGWLAAHQLSPNLLRYNKVWVDPGWEKSGGLLAMVADVMRSAHFAGVDLYANNLKSCKPIPKGCFSFHPQHRNMPRMSERHFRPVASKWVETRMRSLPLPRASKSHAKGKVSSEA
ncbi:Acetyltransferase (GNAT) family protein [Prochlorococcus sp. MIT 1303]|nr:Acetyltransferase (GNAT) family protein [Prochlorococcus sp. MIT 1303]